MPIKFYKSLGHALRGVGLVFLLERNARIHLFFLVVVLILGWFYQLTIIEWAIILLCCGLVIATETVNTAIEKTVDLQTLEKHPLARDAKDLAAGAVLITTALSIVIGLLLFLPKIFK